MKDAAVVEDDGSINLQNGLDLKKELLTSGEDFTKNIDFSEDIEETHQLLIQLQEVQKALDELRRTSEAGLDADSAVNQVRDKVKEAQEQLDVLRHAKKDDLDFENHIGTVNDQTYEQLNNQLQEVADNANEANEDFVKAEATLGKVHERISDINQEAIELSQNSKAVQDIVVNGDKEIQKSKATKDFNQVQEKRVGENAETARQGIDSQQQIKGILDTLNAVQQLTFA